MRAFFYDKIMTKVVGKLNKRKFKKGVDKLLSRCYNKHVNKREQPTPHRPTFKEENTMANIFSKKFEAEWDKLMDEFHDEWDDDEEDEEE